MKGNMLRVCTDGDGGRARVRGVWGDHFVRWMSQEVSSSGPRCGEAVAGGGSLPVTLDSSHPQRLYSAKSQSAD